jgi:hypothetical protein
MATRQEQGSGSIADGKFRSDKDSQLIYDSCRTQIVGMDDSKRGEHGSCQQPSSRVKEAPIEHVREGRGPHAAAGKPRARMDAKILPRAKAVIIVISVIAVAPPEHKVSSQKSRRPDFSFSRIRRPGDDVPIVR